MFDHLKKQPPEDALSAAHLAIHLLDKQLEIDNENTIVPSGLYQTAPSAVRRLAALIVGEITDTEGLSLKQLPEERRNHYAHQIETMMEERFVPESAHDPERIQALLSQVEIGI